MAKYIDKSALVAEIDDWRDKIKKGIFSIPLAGSDKAYATFEYEILGKVRDFIDTLEVKEVGEEPVSNDLEREIKHYVYDPYFDLNGVAVKGLQIILQLKMSQILQDTSLNGRKSRWKRRWAWRKSLITTQKTSWLVIYNLSHSLIYIIAQNISLTSDYQQAIPLPHLTEEWQRKSSSI